MEYFSSGVKLTKLEQQMAHVEGRLGNVQNALINIQSLLQKTAR